ncbi:type III secretion system inner membrane ring lipoprotein SctJ [Lacisediminimonas sp.]|uniref:type III secretion system inner membrane ring lipoprotein SctJ n=1 Tax=Lacisediminimonas sp. TaxID=3060582 RepID=UPI00271E95DB|nr:type III secretion inner membrane ring lipoprotein SctJ [Lacisediminimonas sp.]MDO8301217.1 type III secretion inner membrane ring lipoprotein SctJ [Lacisediminimonas sp.]MDO9217621.1 type III secretion inner membrane ring lipoprotein SctJ [Lacisediminimonas sp.]
MNILAILVDECAYTLRRNAMASLLAVAALLTGCGSQVELLSDTPETEANEVLSALLEANVRASKIPGKEGMVRLAVEQPQVAKAIAVMRAEGLPRERYAKMGDVFRKEGMISSPLEERARYLWALSQELAATVNQIDGVLKARVHVVLPERSSGGEPAMPSSAAVFVKYKRGYNLDDSVAQMKRLVANSIPGLVPDKVSIVLLAASPKPGETNAANMTKVWGMSVANSASDSLQTLLWSLIALMLAALAGAGYLAWRLWGRNIAGRVGTLSKVATGTTPSAVEPT